MDIIYELVFWLNISKMVFSNEISLIVDLLIINKTATMRYLNIKFQKIKSHEF